MSDEFDPVEKRIQSYLKSRTEVAGSARDFLRMASQSDGGMPSRRLGPDGFKPAPGSHGCGPLVVVVVPVALGNWPLIGPAGTAASPQRQSDLAVATSSDLSLTHLPGDPLTSRDGSRHASRFRF